MYIVAITGASGVIIGIKLIAELLKLNKKVAAIVSDAAWETINFEIFKNKITINNIKDLLLKLNFNLDFSSLYEYKDNDFFSPTASGSTKFKAVVVAPCSMKTLSAIATGYADSLITRTVDVALKENKKTIIVPRETPVNLIHLENMVKAKKAGAQIVLPEPAFYTFPKSVDDIINFIIGKILNLLEIEHTLFDSWDKIKKDIFNENN